MSEAKSCVQCQRPIDEWSRICPFCNWNQAEPVLEQQMPARISSYKPPVEASARKAGLMLGGGVLLLVVSFLIGMVINRSDAPDRAPETLEEQAEEHREANEALLRADTPLVPMNEPGGIEQPITSVPAAVPAAGGAPQARTDATAISAAEYAQIARRAADEKKRAALSDPRSITGPSYASRASQSATDQNLRSAPSARRASLRSRPVPRDQSLPHIDGRGTAQLTLLVGPDGRVRRVQIERPLDRNTTALVRAVQRWTFKPATENGEPVTAPYSVRIKYD